ncbi:MAG: hypothetical protein ACE5HI_00615 [bacterium]
MAIPVLTLTPSFTIIQNLVHEFIDNSLGDGYHQIVSQEQAFSRADGEGNISSYKGVNEFILNYNKAKKGSGQVANQLWSFMRARLDNTNEPFYFYNPPENATPDPTGVDTIGRYLVSFKDPGQAMNRTYFLFCLYSYQGIVLREERS